MRDNLFVLSEHNSIANQFLSELRDVVVQKDRMRFRTNLERLGMILAYEVCKKFSFHGTEVETPLGVAPIAMLQDYPVLITILRAGIPFQQGFLQVFDRADCGFIGAYRNEDGAELSINIE